MYDENGMIDRVTNFYSDGYLDEIDKKTHVVVKMICNMKEYLASSSTIKMVIPFLRFCLNTVIHVF